jgi:hypothetical protein
MIREVRALLPLFRPTARNEQVPLNDRPVDLFAGVDDQMTGDEFSQPMAGLTIEHCDYGDSRLE